MASAGLPDTLVGTVIGKRYRVIQRLGSGGVGHVYLVEQLGARRATVRRVVKVLHGEHRDNAVLNARFEREATAAKLVKDHRVLEVLEFGRLDSGLPYFVMELLVGLDLADTLAFSGTLAPARAVRIGYSVALGLSAVHAAGIVHRDIKPENIFLVHAPDGRELVKILDFGFAWMPRDGEEDTSSHGEMHRMVVGTPEYMAPEQAMGVRASPSADVYALGITLYEMLAGRVPFVGEYPKIAKSHVGDEVPPMRSFNRSLDASSELEALIFAALAKDPEHRVRSATDFAQALQKTPEGSLLPRTST